MKGNNPSLLLEPTNTTAIQNDDLSPYNYKRRLIDLGLLYASKSGGVIVGLLILPQFSRLLGPELFGVVALIFTIQAFLLLLDLGMSTLIGRNLAAANTTNFQRYSTWVAAEWVISQAYAILILPVLLITWALSGSLSPVDSLGCLALFWALTLQNVGQSALIACQKFSHAALIQILGIVARHGFTAMALVLVTPTLPLFIIVQTVFAVGQMLITRWLCNKTLNTNASKLIRSKVRKQANALIRSGRPLMLSGLSGAAVMQLDKVIVSSLMSPLDLAPYFLAVTFCLVPISVLAGPVAQLFQPRIIQAASSAMPALTRSTLGQYNYYIAACAILPTAAIWLVREPIISLWLQNSNEVKLVALYSSVLLPGVAIGALGYVPYTILIAHQDYQFQARFSIVMTILTLGATVVAAFQGSVLTICIIYAMYHVTSTFGSWWRCIQLVAGGDGIAAAGARQAILLAFLVILCTACIAIATS